MTFQLCLVIFIAASATIFESSAGNNGLNVNYKASSSLHVDGKRGAIIVDGEGEKELKRNSTSIFSDIDVKEVVTAFNRQRSRIGASNMNYAVCFFSLK